MPSGILYKNGVWFNGIYAYTWSIYQNKTTGLKNGKNKIACKGTHKKKGKDFCVYFA